MQLNMAFPIHKDQKDNFHDLKGYDITIDLDSIEKQFDKTLKQLVDYIDMLGDESTLVQSVVALNESYQELMAQQQAARQTDEELEAIKREYMEMSNNAAPVTIDTIKDYLDHKLEIPSLHQFYEEKHKETKPVITTAGSGSSGGYGAPLTTARLLRILPYIIDDPTCVIPDDNADEDDIQIEGGKIELSCPITYKPYHNPMISKKCGHVFDKEGIQIYFNTPEKKKCPQGACGHELTANDFKPDQLMLLRCKINNMKRPSTNSDNLDIL